jgi:hypothetical protein
LSALAKTTAACNKVANEREAEDPLALHEGHVPQEQGASASCMTTWSKTFLPKYLLVLRPISFSSCQTDRAKDGMLGSTAGGR